jgi:membrane fusion protein, multidrug efflux system
MYRSREREESHSRFQIVSVPEPAPANEAFQPDRAGAVQPTSTQPAAEARTRAPIQPAPAEVAPATPAPTGRGAPRRSHRRSLVLIGVAGLAVAAAGWFGYGWWTVGRFTVSTDDAYVQAYNTTLAAKVAGYLGSVPVTDNTYVHTGDVIATIDDGDYRLAVDSAREKVATQEATVARMAHQITAQEAAVVQAKTQLVSAQAAATRTELELTRQTLLVARDASSHQLLEQAQANRDQAVAGVQGAQAAIDSAAANVDVLKGQRQEAISTLDELKTALAKAERDLSFTVIRAPLDGVIGNRDVQTGDYVQTGQRLASLVPLDEVYVNANFKETQLARLRPGQTASIAVDALPEHTIQGTVESFSPASGAVFSLLPPDNATGNFTKIVQRLPVRIRVPAAVARQGLLRPGMSVVVSVNTKASGGAAGAPPAQTAAR